MRFNQKADAYEQHAFVQKELLTHLEPFIKNIPVPQSILELGAGTGLLTEKLARLFPHAQLTATDLAPRMVQTGQNHHPSATWMELNAWECQHPPVDLITSASLLQWCADPDLACQCWHRALQPNGRMVHGLYVSPTLPELYSLLDQDMISFRDSSQWRAVFERNGFVVHNFSEVKHVHIYPHAKDFLRTLHHTGTVPQRKLDYSEMKNLISNYDQKFRTNDGVHATWTIACFDLQRKG